ncbi:IS3 family transposase [Streptomyces sp. NPDC008121]|uniref:IS3 family transposase n=1 Tax=Streptomyces sp. NPDC008121 TaxID=3364809 RepID=UPI0036E9722B
MTPVSRRNRRPGRGRGRRTDSPGEIRKIHMRPRGAYGAPRVTAVLRRKGRRINRKKVERIMRERGIRGVTRRKRRSMTKADTKAAPSPDLTGRDFTAAEAGTKLVSTSPAWPRSSAWIPARWPTTRWPAWTL